MKLALAVMMTGALISGPSALAQPSAVPHRAVAAPVGSETPPEIEKCLYGDNYSCVLVLKKDRARLSPAATRCVEDLALRGTDDSHPIATAECRNLVVSH